MSRDAAVRVTVLGAVQAFSGTGQVDLGSRLQRALLARLVVEHGHTVSVDRLIDDLWQGEPPPKALAALQVYVSHLRRGLEPGRHRGAPARILVSVAPGYCLKLPLEAVDSWRFEAKVVAAYDDPDPKRRLALLDEALAEWSGEPFAEFGDALWATPEVARLTELRLAAVEYRAAALVELGRYGSAVAALERHMRGCPERESAAALLATALYRSGRQSDALDVLRRIREHLIGELGLEPGRALRDLESDILHHAEHLESARAQPFPQQAVPEAVRTGPDHAAYGRAGELAAIEAAARSDTPDGATVVWIGGEAGSGKTTLAGVAADRLRASGWRIVAGRCPEVDGAPAGWAWTEVLRDLIASDHHAAEVTDRQALAPLLHEGGAAGPGTFWLGQAVADVLTAVARRRPLAVVLDDLHRTDGLTLELLRLVADRIGDCRVLVIGTYRPSEDRGELEVARAALTVRTAAHLELDGLDSAATAALAADCGLTSASGEVLRLLRERTGGNPLFVRELARLIAAEGPAAVRASVPVGVRDVMRRRLARLPDQTVTALRRAAVLGHDIDVDLLAELARSDPDELLDALEPAVLLGLLDEPEPRRLRFAHGLVRDTLYEDISKLRRSRWHGEVLDLLRAPGRSVDAATLAYHAVAAATEETASGAALFATVAAQEAGAVGAHAEAVRQWRAVLQMLELAGGSDALDREIEARCGLIAALAQSGDAVAARLECKGALQLLTGKSRDDLTVRVLTAWDTPLVWRDREYDESDNQMITLLRRVLADGAATGITVADRIRLLKALFVELEGADPEGALAASTELLELARQAHAERPESTGRLLCTALNVRAYCALGPDLDFERESLAAELLSAAESTEQADYQAVGHWLLSLAAGQRSDLATAKRHADLAVARAGTGQLVHLLGMLGLFRARMYLLAGRLDEAVHAYTDLAARMVENGAANGAKLAMVGRVTGEFCLGDLGQLADELLYFYREVSVAALDAAVLALIARGRGAEAEQLWRERRPIERSYFWVPYTVLRVNAAAALGDVEETAARAAELVKYSGQIAGLGVDGLMLGPVDEALAVAADALGRPDEAREYRAAAAVLRERLANEALAFID